MRVRILPYKMGSQGASKLAEGIRASGTQCFKVFPNRRYFPKRDHFLVNWGSGTKPDWYSSRFCSNMLNKPQNVALASNKLDAFQAWESWNKACPEAQVPIPEFTTDEKIANSWNVMFLGRKLLQGHSGKGILIFDPAYPMGEGGLYPAPSILNPHTQDACPLYVKYIKKKHEYRVHVFKGKVIDIQQKRKRTGHEEIDYKVRTHAGGWVFCRSEINPSPSCTAASINAVRALGLDFGAVDVIWNEHYKKAYVLEVNTAPGLEGTTIQNYVKAIKELL